jgi:hypothetical protein
VWRRVLWFDELVFWSWEREVGHLRPFFEDWGYGKACFYEAYRERKGLWGGAVATAVCAWLFYGENLWVVICESTECDDMPGLTRRARRVWCAQERCAEWEGTPTYVRPSVG